MDSRFSDKCSSACGRSSTFTSSVVTRSNSKHSVCSTSEASSSSGQLWVGFGDYHIGANCIMKYNHYGLPGVTVCGLECSESDLILALILYNDNNNFLLTFEI